MKFSPFSPFNWQLAHDRTLTLGPEAVIMGILNVTPDSFSDGGKFHCADDAIKQANKMRRAGAKIIDIGGESTRPGAEPVTLKTEQERVLPVIETLAGKSDIILSIDTWHAETADKAIQAGAHIINDVWGFQKDKNIARVAKKHNAGCVLMHTGRERKKHKDPVTDQILYLTESIKIAEAAGISSNHIILDPGFGFAKDVDENLEILARFEEIFTLGKPLLTGTSRKRFIAAIAGVKTINRDRGTAATSVVARMKGSAVFRVHDVAKNADALKIADAVIKSNQ